MEFGDTSQGAQLNFAKVKDVNGEAVYIPYQDSGLTLAKLIKVYKDITPCKNLVSHRDVYFKNPKKKIIYESEYFKLSGLKTEF